MGLVAMFSASSSSPTKVHRRFGRESREVSKNGFAFFFLFCFSAFVLFLFLFLFIYVVRQSNGCAMSNS